MIAKLFDKRRARRIEQAKARMAPLRTFEERVCELARILDEDGYLAEYELADDGTFNIVEHNCAILAVALRYGNACSSELEFIRAVLPEADRRAHLAHGRRRAPLRLLGPPDGGTEGPPDEREQVAKFHPWRGKIATCSEEPEVELGGGGRRRRLALFVGQRDRQDLADLRGQVERHLVPDGLGHVVHVRPVAGREDDLGQARRWAARTSASRRRSAAPCPAA